MTNTETTTMTKTDMEAATDRFINAHLDMLEAGMKRWNCGPVEALAAFMAMQGERYGHLNGTARGW